MKKSKKQSKERLLRGFLVNQKFKRQRNEFRNFRVFQYELRRILMERRPLITKFRIELSQDYVQISEGMEKSYRWCNFISFRQNVFMR